MDNVYCSATGSEKISKFLFQIPLIIRKNFRSHIINSQSYMSVLFCHLPHRNNLIFQLSTHNTWKCLFLTNTILHFSKRLHYITIFLSTNLNLFLHLGNFHDTTLSKLSIFCFIFIFNYKSKVLFPNHLPLTTEKV